ncbi:hypothetical protein ACIP2X_05300 [Streptomyces sp. NPDC089424]|uniref:hypothetical protein n=1 Tax=Streptomyces sp. NPDC089424 TaxID=3365917 RepID=UPI0038157268
MSRPERGTRPARSAVPWSVALRGAVRGGALLQTIVAASSVGSVLFMVNLYTQVRQGPLTWALAARIVLTFFVPWLNATLGLALGLRKTNREAGQDS